MVADLQWIVWLAFALFVAVQIAVSLWLVAAMHRARPPWVAPDGAAVHGLAPMDGVNLGMSVFVALIVSFALPILGPAILFGIYRWARPCAFDLARDALRVRFFGRIEVVPYVDVVGVEPISRAELRRRYGYGMRCGSGGFGGGFGKLIASRATFRMWISRLDGLVLIHVRRGESVLVSPVEPERFCATLEAMRR